MGYQTMRRMLADLRDQGYRDYAFWRRRHGDWCLRVRRPGQPWQDAWT